MFNSLASGKKYTERYPFVANFVLEGTSHFDARSLGEHVATLPYNRNLATITDVNLVPRDPDHKKRLTDSATKWLAFWASKRRVIANLHIVKVDGSICSSLDETADALHDHWAPIFSAKPVSKTVAVTAILPHIAKVNPDTFHALSFERFCAMLELLTDSGVGTDACPYSLWKYAPLAAVRRLYDAYLYLGLFIISPSKLQDLLSSRIVFIQKGVDEGDAEGRFLRRPGKTRPLTLSNTDAKLISKAGAISLAAIASETISRFQVGGMKGLQMVDLIVRMEAKILDYIARRLPSAGIIALDVAAIFPSLSRKVLF